MYLKHQIEAYLLRNWLKTDVQNEYYIKWGIEVKKLSNKQEGTLRRLGIRKQIKLIRLTTKIYNTLCIDCKHRSIQGGDLDPESYCIECQDKVAPIVKKIERLCE